MKKMYLHRTFLLTQEEEEEEQEFDIITGQLINVKEEKQKMQVGEKYPLKI